MITWTAIGLCLIFALLAKEELKGFGVWLACVAWLVGWMFGSGWGRADHWDHHDIVAIADGTGFHGYVSLFGGSIDSDARYRFYWRDGNRLQLENVQASDVILTEDSSQPYFERYAGCSASPKVFWPTSWCYRGENFGPRYMVHVPPDSVTRKIDLSLNP